jgi:hypothetical protein
MMYFLCKYQYRNWNLLKLPLKGVWNRKENKGGDEPVWGSYI